MVCLFICFSFRGLEFRWMENCSVSGRSSVVRDRNNRNLLHSQEKEDIGKTTVKQAVPEMRME